jgi:hypothetical protein
MTPEEWLSLPNRERYIYCGVFSPHSEASEVLKELSKFSKIFASSPAESAKLSNEPKDAALVAAKHVFEVTRCVTFASPMEMEILPKSRYFIWSVVESGKYVEVYIKGTARVKDLRTLTNRSVPINSSFQGDRPALTEDMTPRDAGSKPLPGTVYISPRTNFGVWAACENVEGWDGV